MDLIYTLRTVVYVGLAAWCGCIVIGVLGYMTWSLMEETVLHIWRAHQPRYFKPSATQPARDLRDHV